jgi:hypothetical protein
MSIKKNSRTTELTSVIFGRRIVEKMITRRIIFVKITPKN